MSDPARRRGAEEQQAGRGEKGGIESGGSPLAAFWYSTAAAPRDAICRISMSSSEQKGVRPWLIS